MAKKRVISKDWIINDAGFLDQAKVTYTTEDGERYVQTKQFTRGRDRAVSAAKRDEALDSMLAENTIDTDKAAYEPAGKKKWWQW